MTALKPIENRRVRAVASESYPSNRVCAHPDCGEKVELRPDGTPTVHHAFPRSFTKSDSYFVVVTDDEGFETEPIPHAVGLCGSGTTGHHGDVEEHRAWLKFEEGVWNWYERATRNLDDLLGDAEWQLLGPLNPQPGSVEGKTKKKAHTGAARRRRVNWQVAVPKDAQEDGAGILDDLIEQLRGHVEIQELYPDEKTPAYFILVAALNVAVTS